MQNKSFQLLPYVLNLRVVDLQVSCIHFAKEGIPIAKWHWTQSIEFVNLKVG